jgi:predicted alpha/beta-hydrolase family hydrolase
LSAAKSQVDTRHGAVSLLHDGPEDAPVTIVLAPGAGADMSHVFMQTIASGLADQGFAVKRFNFLYAERGRKAPDKQPVLEDTYRDVVASMDAKKLILGGKSMGGRIASHVVADGLRCDGLLFLGYPLHPPGKPERIRDAHLYDISVPMLFIEGTRDPFCPLETLERVRTKLRAPTDVVAIEDGDHSFKVPKSSGRSTDDAWREVIAAATVWVQSL